MKIKNAGKAAIANKAKAPTKETVKTPFSECTAKDKLRCRYHGLQALDGILSKLLEDTIFSATQHKDGHYSVKVLHPITSEKARQLADFFKEQGYGFSKDDSAKGGATGFEIKKLDSAEDDVAEMSEQLTEADKADLEDSGAEEVEGLEDFLLEYEMRPDKGAKKGEESAEDADRLSSKELDSFLLGDEGFLDESGEGQGDQEDLVTPEEVKDFIVKIGQDANSDFDDWYFLATKGRDYDGNPIEGMPNYIAAVIEGAGEDHPVSKALKKQLLKSGSPDITDADIKKFCDSFCENVDEGVYKAWKELTTKGESNGQTLKNLYELAPAKFNQMDKSDPVAKKLIGWLHKQGVEIAASDEELNSKKKALTEEWQQLQDNVIAIELNLSRGFDNEAASDLWSAFNKALKDKDIAGAAARLEEFKGLVQAAADALVNKEESKDIAIETSEHLYKPLEHDASKFPPKDIGAHEIELAIKAGKILGGHGGCEARLIEIGGKKYVCKRGKGFKAVHLKNGYYADMAYRAGGIPAPDAEIYEYGDGRTFKLSEFIEGKMLSKAWIEADEAKKEEIRKEILKGYALDALFSNHDVLGTGFDNIILDKDGRAWRIDNDGSFAMSATGKVKTWDYGDMVPKKPVDVERYDYWDEREWIDDFRKMRRMERNKGIFDHFSTAAIFTAAGNINLDAAVASLPEAHREALRKPLYEMKQMTWRAINFAQGGYKNDAFVSLALDTSYEASKRGLRERCQKKVTWYSPGFGGQDNTKSVYKMKPFDEPMPTPPKDPRTVLDSHFPNTEYTGSIVANIIYNAAKSINYHMGEQSLDANGNVLGSGNVQNEPDFNPPTAKIAPLDRIDAGKLAKLAEEDASAKVLLGMFDQIMESKESGWHKPITDMAQGLSITAKLPEGYKSPYEESMLAGMEDEISDYKKALKKYEEVDKPAYEKRKREFEAAEEKKALASGKEIYKDFNDFASRLMSKGIDTDGIEGRVENGGIEAIEEAMHDQKGNSYKGYGKDWKIRLWQGMGLSLDEIMDNLKNGKFINGQHQDDGYGTPPVYMTDVITRRAKGKPREWQANLNSQAMYLGMLMLYLENAQNPDIDHNSGVVFLSRNIPSSEKVQGLTPAEAEIYKNQTKEGWVGAHPYAAADCCQFETNNWHNANKQVYALPFSHVICCGNFTKKTGEKMEEGYGENEWAGNCMNMPCYVYHEGMYYDWQTAKSHALASKGMQKWLKGLEARSKAFNTLDK